MVFTKVIPPLSSDSIDQITESGPSFMPHSRRLFNVNGCSSVTTVERVAALLDG